MDTTHHASEETDPIILPGEAPPTSPDHARPSLLETGGLPLLDLAVLANREGFRPRPIYQMHKWFARRLGTSFRAILTSAQAADVKSFWDIYYGRIPGSLAGKSVLDPFVGGGTSLVESERFGANAIGQDVDPVACLVTTFELEAGQLPDLHDSLAELKRDVGESIQHFYRLSHPEEGELTVVHWFWVQTVTCKSCRTTGDANPNHLLAEDNRHRVVFCPDCGDVRNIRLGAKSFRCTCSGRRHSVDVGNVVDGKYQCLNCGDIEPLISVARRAGRPKYRLFAAEVADTLEHHPTRRFLRTTEADAANYRRACRRLSDDLRRYGKWGSDMDVHLGGMGDSRLESYGYSSWTQLFNSRQLLHLRLLERAIASRPISLRRPLALAFSSHLTANCMFASYTAKWRRLTPLFSIRGFRHIARPVELNPWLDGIGRGTYPNAVRKIMRATEFAKRPKEPVLTGGFCDVPRVTGGSHSVRCVDSSREGKLEAASIDLVLTDPPYFDFIHYAGLASFFSPWLARLGLTPKPNRKSVAIRSLAGRRECAVSTDRFSDRMASVFLRSEELMKPGALMAFTYRHSMVEGWSSLARALLETNLLAVQVFPLPGEARSGLHVEDGSSRWDAVLVLRKPFTIEARPPIRCGAISAVNTRIQHWDSLLAGARKLQFSRSDRENLRRAQVVGAMLGQFPSADGERLGTAEALALLEEHC